MVIRENFRQTDCIFSLSSMDEEIREEHLANNIYNCRYGRRRERICHGYAQSQSSNFYHFSCKCHGKEKANLFVVVVATEIQERDTTVSNDSSNNKVFNASLSENLI